MINEKEIKNCKMKDADGKHKLDCFTEHPRKWVCTRPRGHKGFHHAHGGEYCFARWK